MSGAQIVSVEWLKSQLDSGADNVRILDVSWYSTKDAKDEYLKGHIPGAVYLNPMDGAKNNEFFPRNLSGIEVFEKNACAAGINASTHVVVYDSVGQAGFFIGARAWWTFTYYGHEKVSVLNGGFQAWQKADYPVSTEVPTYPSGTFKPTTNRKIIRSYEEMEQNKNCSMFQVVDSRANEAYTNGHFPKAVNLPLASKLIDPQRGVLRSDTELKKAYEEAGLELSKPVVGMCFSGMSSCTVALTALHLGATDVAVYLGGFTEWSKRAKDEQIEKS